MSESSRLIEDIKSRQTSSDKEFILDSLTGAIDRLQKAFPRYGSFLMEFVQNADDAKSESLKIEVFQNFVRISNDGTEFTDNDVKSICKVGRSSKTPKDYIGYLGVGFKAVFLVSNAPEIYSGTFSFKFDQTAWPDHLHTPWQVIPLWLGTFPFASRDFTTVFNLPLKEEKLIETIRDEIRPEQLSERILLFLRNIKLVVVSDGPRGHERRIVKSELSRTSEYEIHQIQEYENGELKRQDRWLLFRNICPVPTSVKEDYVTRDWERDNVETREVIVAVKLDDGGNLTPESKGTAHIGVFSFLPLKEVPSGLSFLIQADFLTTPGRGELARESLWNDWLAQEIYELITNRCIPTFLKNDKWRMNFTEIFYSYEGGHPLFDKHIKRQLRDYLTSNPILVAEDGSLAKADNLVEVDREVKQLLAEKDLATMFPNKTVLHEACKPHPDLRVETAPSELYGLLQSNKIDPVLNDRAAQHDIEWFKDLYNSLSEKYTLNHFEKKSFRYNVEYDTFWNRLRNFDKPIILTASFQLARINDCYTNQKRLTIPESIQEKFNIVHPDLVPDKGFQKFLRSLNDERHYSAIPERKVVQALTEEDIRKAVKQQQTLEMNPSQWQRLDDTERVDTIRHLKDLWNRGYLTLENYKFLTVKTKKGNWLEAEELLFSKEYIPDHHLDEICNEKQLCDLPIEFVNPEFVQNLVKDEISQWQKFFKELGVEKKRETDKGFVRNVVSRIGVLSALRYERSKGRGTSQELSRSQEIGGYDIEQFEETEEGYGFIQSTERYIEVKSSSSPNPDIFLTSKQFNTLREKQESYFVYVVKDALRYPTLSVVRGDRLATVQGIKAIIPFNKWSGLAREEEFQL